MNGDFAWITNFIWGIADDVLRDLYVRGKYRDVILPMTVLRRLDAVLEPTKKGVLDAKANLDKAKITNQDAKRRVVQFTNGSLIASLQATPLGEKITQLVIASNLGPQPDATSLVVQGVLRVCKDMNVECTLVGQ